MIQWIVGGCFIPLTIYIAIKLVFLHTSVEYHYNQGPRLLVLIVKAIYRIITRRQGKLYLSSGDSKIEEDKTRILADKSERVVFKNCRIDDAKLKEYSQLCGEGLGVPFCYLESLFMPSLVILATGSCFKLSPLGLIHIRQTIQIHQPLDNLIEENFDLESTVKEYRVVERGIEVDIGLSVINHIGFCAWEGVVTLLSRSLAQKSGNARDRIRKTSVSTLDNGAISSTIRVKGDTGLKYAWATGDWNPHHLYPWTAKLLGYRQPIAHGMWVLGKMISLIQFGQRLENYPISIQAVFRRPLFMPGETDFKYSKTSSNRYDFRVIDTASAIPHLTGSVISKLPLFSTT